MIRRVVRRRRGGWSVQFDVEDRREPTRLLKRTPPRYSADLMEPRSQGAARPAEIDKARIEGAYTANRTAAVDVAEAVPMMA